MDKEEKQKLLDAIDFISEKIKNKLLVVGGEYEEVLKTKAFYRGQLDGIEIIKQTIEDDDYLTGILYEGL